MKKAPFLPVLIGTGFGSGFSPFAPGTAGALLASIIWIALYLLLPFSVVLWITACLLYTSPSPRDRTRSRMPSSA